MKPVNAPTHQHIDHTAPHETTAVAAPIAVTLPPGRVRLSDKTVLCNSFTDTPSGAGDLAEAARTATREQGAWWAADKVGRLAFAASMWLLGHDHPPDTYLAVAVSYNPEDRFTVVSVDDPGAVTHGERGVSKLPHEVWRDALDLPQLSAFVLWIADGRRLHCRFRVRDPHRVRITWDPAVAPEKHQPTHTYEGCLTRQDAEAKAREAAARPGVSAVHVQLPEDEDHVWHAWHGDE